MAVTLSFQYAAPASKTAAGLTAFNNAKQTALAAALFGKGLTNDNGAERRPMIIAREKLRVAREERNMPRSRREKDLMRLYCWRVGRWNVVRRLERVGGRIVLIRRKSPKRGVRSWKVLLV